MQDFNSYSKEEQKEQKRSEQSAAESDRLAKQLASALAGKGEADILRAIYKEAEGGRKAGTLTDEDLDRFAAALSPMLDAAKRKKPATRLLLTPSLLKFLSAPMEPQNLGKRFGLRRALVWKHCGKAIFRNICSLTDITSFSRGMSCAKRPPAA